MSSDLILVRTTPFSTAVVSQICSPRMIGEERPRPVIRTFHAILLVSLQVTGGSACGAQPLPAGPRNCGQSRAEEEQAVRSSVTAKIRTDFDSIVFRVSCSVTSTPGIGTFAKTNPFCFQSGSSRISTGTVFNQSA